MTTSAGKYACRVGSGKPACLLNVSPHCKIKIKRKQKQTSINNDLPAVILDEIFVFLSITDYLCNVLLVCKQWNLNSMKDMMKNKTHLIRKLVYNSCITGKSTLTYFKEAKYSLTAYDLIHEYELSAAYTVYTSSMKFQSESLQCQLQTLPKYSLYFDLDIEMRKIVSYKYLFNYIYLLHFGKRNNENLHKLCVLFMRLLFSGGTLCIGFMLELLFEKYVTTLDCVNYAFWCNFKQIFELYFKYYQRYMKDKPRWVIGQSFYHLLVTGERYLKCFSEKQQKHINVAPIKPWVKWAQELEKHNQSDHIFYPFLMHLYSHNYL